MSDAFDAYKEWLDIPPQEQPPNYYRLLDLPLFEDMPGLIQDAVAKRTELLKTYQLSQHSAQCQDLLNEIAAASVCLLDRGKKAAYDEQLRFGLEPEVASAPLVKKPGKKSSKKTPNKASEAPRKPSEQADGVLGPSRPKKGGKKTADTGQYARWALKFGIPAAVLVVGLVLTVILVGRGGGGAKYALLVVDWPEDQREDVRLEVNGQSVTIPGTGPCKHHGKPGTYQIVAARPGFRTFRRSLFIEGGQTGKIHLEWKPTAETASAVPDPLHMDAIDPAAEDAMMEPQRPIADDRAAREPSSAESAAEAAQENLQNAVVRIVMTGPETPQSAVGFIVDPAGVIATSYRAVKSATGAQVIFRDRPPSEVLGYVVADESRDLALLRLKDGDLAGPAIAGDAPAAGDPLTALGPPESADSNTPGIVSALRRGDLVRTLLEAAGGADAEFVQALDPQTAWIETTATISPQQNGCPLVNADGEVVGMCVWTGAAGLAAGFALDVREIVPLLRSAGFTCYPLGSLADASDPMSEESKEPEEPEEPDGPVEFVLGSGRVFRLEEFDIDEKAAEGLINEGGGVSEGAEYDPRMMSQDGPGVSEGAVEVKHGSLFHVGYARHRGGTLNGLTILFHDEETPMLYVNYADNKRQGLLVLWDETGGRRYLSEWSENKRNGVCCLFEDEEPHLICECVDDEYAFIGLVAPGGDLKPFKTEIEALKDNSAGIALAAVKDIENRIKTTHLSLQRNVKNEAQKPAEERRRALASRQSVAKRAAAISRIGARGAEQRMRLQNQVRNALQ